MFRRLLKNWFMNLLTSNVRTQRRGAKYSEKLEDRTLLSSVNLVGTILTIGGDGGNNQFEVSYDGTNYTLVDHSGNAFNINAALSLPDLDAATNRLVFDPNHASIAGFTQLRINGNIGNDSVTVTNFRSGAEGFWAGSQTESVIINGNLGSSGSPVLNPVRLDASAIQLNASIFTSNQAVDVVDPVTLGANVQIAAGSGIVHFTRTIDGGFELDVSGGSVLFDQGLGQTTALAGLKANAATQVRFDGNVTVDGGNIDLTTDSLVVNGTSLSGNREFSLGRSTAGTQSFNQSFFSKLQPGFTAFLLGDALTTTLTLPADADNTLAGSLNLVTPTTFSGVVIVVNETLNQSAELTFIADTQLQFNGIGAAVGTGDLTIADLHDYLPSATPTLVVTGNIGFASGTTPWGAARLSISGSDVAFMGGVGSSFTGITATADILRFNQPSAVTASGDISLTANTIHLSGGIFSQTGDVTVTGDITLTGNVLFKAGAGQNVAINGSVTGAIPYNVLVRGEGGALAHVTFAGNVSNVANFFVDAAGVNTAQNVSLQNVAARSITLRGLVIDLAGDLSASVGNVEIVGATTISTDLTITSPGDTKFTRFQGTVNGGNNLFINAGTGKAIFLGVVGGVTPLYSLTVQSGGAQVITHDISVADTFQWNISEVATNGDNLTLNLGKSINAGTSILINVADKFINKNGGLTRLNSPLVTVMQE